MQSLRERIIESVNKSPSMADSVIEDSLLPWLKDYADTRAQHWAKMVDDQHAAEGEADTNLFLVTKLMGAQMHEAHVLTDLTTAIEGGK